MKMPLKFQPRYFIAAMLLFIVEVLIALYIHDTIIRPYFGDVLVVILIYVFIKSFINFPVFSLAVGVLIFAYTIEVLQYFNLVKLLGVEQSYLARVILGTTFQWIDFVAYTVGIAIVLAMERRSLKPISS